MRLLVTGGAGFIGSAVIRHLIANTSYDVANVDKLSYAGNLASLGHAVHSRRYRFYHHDICDAAALKRIFTEFQPTVVMHLAAESHVDRSIAGPGEFIQTNIVGTYELLEAARTYWMALPPTQQQAFRFHHVSTDEVYGDLAGTDELFTETSTYAPSSPYSASKASSDHLVRAWQRTYGLPTLITHCSNNYGPYQFPEKLIPRMILNALAAKPLPLYGDGLQIRDWLYVEDHARALVLVAQHGVPGDSYAIGGHNERSNLEVVTTLCTLLDELHPRFVDGQQHSYQQLITFVQDRPGHDVRYAIDAAKIERELGWTPNETFETGLGKTVQWYLDKTLCINDYSS